MRFRKLLFLILVGFFSCNAFAAEPVAKEDMTPPPLAGALGPEKVPPVSSIKTSSSHSTPTTMTAPAPTQNGPQMMMPPPSPNGQPMMMPPPSIIKVPPETPEQ